MILREEIEKAAREYGFPDGIAPCHFNVIVDFTLAQVEKADYKAREDIAVLIENSLIRKDFADIIAQVIRTTIKKEK